jgi:hypothetical protein
MLHTANASKSFRCEESPKSFDVMSGVSTSVLQYTHGRKSRESSLNVFNLATLNKTLKLNASIGRAVRMAVAVLLVAASRNANLYSEADMTLPPGPPQYGDGLVQTKAATGHGCVTLLLLRPL